MSLATDARSVSMPVSDETSPSQRTAALVAGCS
jgi:hypothetical protein